MQEFQFNGFCHHMFHRTHDLYIGTKIVIVSFPTINTTMLVNVEINWVLTAQVEALYALKALI